jgi:hypothetical protein
MSWLGTIMYFAQIKIREDYCIYSYYIILRSAGGLGCFIENVQPILKAVNRSKNKSIPLVSFNVTKEYESLNKIVKAYQKIASNKEDKFSREKEVFSYAERIIKITHGWCIEEQRKFYEKISEKYDKSYFMKSLNHQKRSFLYG